MEALTRPAKNEEVLLKILKLQIENDVRSPCYLKLHRYGYGPTTRNEAWNLLFPEESNIAWDYVWEEMHEISRTKPHSTA